MDPALKPIVARDLHTWRIVSEASTAVVDVGGVFICSVTLAHTSQLFLLCYYVHVSKKKPVMRRRMSIVNRKTILSYYTQEEAHQIARAAKQRGMSISNFVATAALREAAVEPKNTPKE
jgi:hypothetical protein